MIYLIRGSHANEFELQNYLFPGAEKKIKVITSHHPLTSTKLPQINLFSPTDLPDFPFRRQIFNRLIGGEQWLIGLEKYLTNCYHVSKHGNKKDQLIVHTAETYTPYTHQAVKMRMAGVIDKLICTCWETIPFNNEKFARLRAWKQEAFEYVDLFHTPTLRARDALMKEGVSPDKIRVIPYGVDLTRFHPTKDKKRKNRPLILTVARLTKEKGMADLESIARSLPNLDFLVVGAGNYHLQGANIRHQIVPYQDIHKLYHAADLFFLPSRSTPTWEEQYGMALVEAMASGLPIVTTNSGAIPEVVGSSAIICKEGDKSAMIEAIEGVLHYSCNPEILRSSTVARVKRLFDARKISRELLKLYT